MSRPPGRPISGEMHRALMPPTPASCPRSSPTRIRCREEAVVLAKPATPTTATPSTLEGRHAVGRSNPRAPGNAPRWWRRSSERRPLLPVIVRQALLHRGICHLTTVTPAANSTRSRTDSPAIAPCSWLVVRYNQGRGGAVEEQVGADGATPRLPVARHQAQFVRAGRSSGNRRRGLHDARVLRYQTPPTRRPPPWTTVGFQRGS